MGKNNFLVSDEWGAMIKSLPKDKAGELFQGLYELRDNPDYEIEDPVISAIFQMMKAYVNGNEEKYHARCEKNAENGAKSHDNKPKKAKKSERKQSVANATDSNQNTAEVSLSLSSSISEIINYLNTKTGKNYSDTASETKRLITARLNEGYTVEDFKWLIDTKVGEWIANEKMQKYLRPNTLFAPSHFDNYLNQTSRPKPKEVEESPPNNRIHYDCEDFETSKKYRDMGYMIDDDGYWIDKDGNWITEDST